MKASEANLITLLRKSSQFIIPIYQRKYSWTEKECRQLWDDIIRTGSNENITMHFMGSIVYIEEGLSQVSLQAPLLVIDGQQRLTTITLVLAALIEYLGDEEPVDGFSLRKIRNYYLLNTEESDDRYYKLILSDTDKDTLLAIVNGNELPENSSLRIIENYSLFKDLVSSKNNDLKTICKGISKLAVVDIALSRDQDNPQLIFESMNSTGRELSQSDLIRNFILMGLEPKLQSHLYETYWRPMEISFGQEAYDYHFDRFMRNYLTVKTGEIPKIDEVYEGFKTYSRLPKIAEEGIEALVKDIRNYGKYYCSIALGLELDKDLNLAFQELRELNVEVSYPLLLELYNDYTNDILQKEDFLEAVRLIETYIFRRSICSIPTNSLNKTFATFSKLLKKDRYLESIEAQFMIMQSYRRLPRDEEFLREIKIRDIYNFRSRSYWLRKFENYGRKERVSIGEYTIEHIMPQNPDLSGEWQKSLGTDWQTVHETWLHTLGNLTLTGYNSEYGDRPFTGKRDMEGGFKDSPLKVNEGLGGITDWNEQEIKNRANKLAKKALLVWPIPKLSAEIVEEYKPKVLEKREYSIDDHPNLQKQIVNEIFITLSKEIKALDPCVTEEFLKLYIAYKAETNFVDIIPQAKQLVLSINMKFYDIEDPYGICRDVTNQRRWGNGDIEVRVKELKEIPYIMGLIRQSLESQLGNDKAVE